MHWREYSTAITGRGKVREGHVAGGAAECYMSFKNFPEKEEKLVGRCISKKIWDRICANAPNFENATLEEIKARLDPNFVPEGWLDTRA